MQYKTSYQSPLGEIILTANSLALTGLWFSGQFYSTENYIEKENSVIKETISWLDIYFNGIEPNFKPKVHFSGTNFQNEVWEILSTIPYGQTMTYGEIAKIIAKRREVDKISAQAIGSAVGKNRISIVIPCHRVLGANGKLVGYAGGLYRKAKLLALENIKVQQSMI